MDAVESPAASAPGDAEHAASAQEHARNCPLTPVAEPKSVIESILK